MNFKHKAVKGLHSCSLASILLISQLVMRVSATGRNLEKEAEVAKSIVLYQLVEPSDNMFERRMKSLVSNFLVNTAISLHQSQSQEEDYDELPLTTEKPEEKWPSYFGDKSTFSQVEGNKTTTTPPSSKKLFTWPSFFFPTSEIPSTEATTLNQSLESESEIINPGQSQQFSSNGNLQIQLLPTGSLQVNQINPNSEYEPLANSPPHSIPNGGVDGNIPSQGNNIPYQNQNNFQNAISSFQSGQTAHQQFQGQSQAQYNNQQSGNQWTQQNQNQLHSQQNPQTLNQYNQPLTNRFVSNNQFQMPNQNSIQNNGNNFLYPTGPQQQITNVNQYLPNMNNLNVGPNQYRPNFVPSNQNPILQQQQNVLPPQGNLLSSPGNNVLVWPDSFMTPQVNYETTTPALLPNVPGQSINFFTTRPTTPPKKVFTWPSYFLKSTEPIPTQPWSLPEAPIYLTPSPDDIYSPPKRISAWSQFPSMPLTSPKPFRHYVNTVRTPPTTTKRSFNPFKIFTWPSFYFTSTSTVNPAPAFVPTPNENLTNLSLMSNNSDNNSLLRQEGATTVIPSPRPEPQKSAPEPPMYPTLNEITSPMTLLSIANPTPTTIQTVVPKEQEKIESSTVVSNSSNISIEANTMTRMTTTAKPKTTQKPKPVRKPAGLIGAIQHFTLIVPDALRPGRNTTSILNKQSVNSILKIIGSVAFLNLSGVIDNSVQLGTSDPVRELVSGVSGLVLCNPIVKQITAGRCTRELKKGHVLEHVLNY